MPAETREYQRLPGSGRVSTGFSLLSSARTSSTLWMAQDHLLQVNTQGGYSDTYKRFYYRDIQAVVFRKTNAWFIGNGILLSFVALFLLIAFVAKEPGLRTGMIFFAGGLMPFLLWNIITGPTRACYLKTAVHWVELSSLRRVKRVRKTLERLRPKLDEFQGTFSPETMVSQFEKLRARPGAAGAEAELAGYDSKAHGLFFFGLLLNAVIYGADIFLPNQFLVFLALLDGLFMMLSFIFALIKQRETDLSGSIKSASIISIVYVGLSFFVAYVVIIVQLGAKAGNAANYADFASIIGNLSAMEKPWWLAILLANAIISLLLGLLGIVLLQRYQAKKPLVAGPAATAEPAPRMDVPPVHNDAPEQPTTTPQ